MAGDHGTQRTDSHEMVSALGLRDGAGVGVGVGHRASDLGFFQSQPDIAPTLRCTDHCGCSKLPHYTSSSLDTPGRATAARRIGILQCGGVGFSAYHNPEIELQKYKTVGLPLPLNRLFITMTTTRQQ